MNKLLTLVLLTFLVVAPPFLQASNIASDWVKVTEIRSITDGNVFFTVDQVTMCNTNTFLLKTWNEVTKSAYTNLLAAAATGKEVRLETWGNCAENGGWGTEVQGISIKIL